MGIGNSMTDLNPHKVIVFACHQKMKFPTRHGIGEVKGDQQTSRRCYVNTLRRRNKKKLSIQTDDDPREEARRPTPVDALVEVVVDSVTRIVRNGVTLPTRQAEQVTELLIKFKEFFAWSPSDMSGIAIDVIANELHLDRLIKTMTQRIREMGEEKRLVIRSEVGKLVDAGFVKEVRLL